MGDSGSLQGEGRDLDGTDIRDDDLGIVESVGSCENCGVNIYEESLDSGLCDQCEWATHYPSRHPTEDR